MTAAEPHWAPVLERLDRAAASGRVLRFWLRDDDAVAPTPALERLLAFCTRAAVPAALAVIPAGAEEALARRLAGETYLDICQHGFDHRNHAPAGEKARELGPDRPAATVLADLERGRDRLAALFGPRVVPVLVPPWNRIDAALLPALAARGFRALSTYGGPPDRVHGLARLDTHLDLIDWRGGRIGQDHAALASMLAEAIDRRLAEGPWREAPVGILTHHLVHDETAWSFLDALAACLAVHPAARWVSLRTLIPPA